MKQYNYFLKTSKNLCTNLGVIVLIGFTSVLSSLVPLILKLAPKIPSPFLPVKTFPIIGMPLTILLIVFAGARLPDKLVKLSLPTLPSIINPREGPVP